MSGITNEQLLAGLREVAKCAGPDCMFKMERAILWAQPTAQAAGVFDGRLIAGGRMTTVTVWALLGIASFGEGKHPVIRLAYFHDAQSCEKLRAQIAEKSEHKIPFRCDEMEYVKGINLPEVSPPLV